MLGGLRKKVGLAVWWNRLGWTLAKVWGAIEKDAKMNGFDPKITLKKAGGALLEMAFGAAVAAVVVALSDQTAVAVVLEAAGMSKAIAVSIAMVVAAGARGAGNWWKHRKPAAPAA